MRKSYRRYLHRLLLAIWLGVVLLALAVVRPQPATAQAGGGSALVAAVNALRASYGLAPFKANAILMFSAQAHSEYQASIGTYTHTGKDGSDETGRAMSAGYGGGQSILCDEDVGWGYNLSPDGAVDLWQDPEHLAIMLSKVFKDAGGGVGVTSDNKVFYTLDVCLIRGATGDTDPSGATSSSGVAQTAAQATSSGPSLLPVVPIQTSTPRADGAVIHVVQSGQTVYTIAEAYGAKVADIMAYNGLTDKSVIYPGDPLLIVLPSTPSASSTLTETLPVTQTVTMSLTVTTEPTGTPTPRRPTSTAPVITPTAIALLAQSNPEAPGAADVVAQAPPSGSQRGADYLLIAIIVLGGIGLALVGLGSTLKRSQ